MNVKTKRRLVRTGAVVTAWAVPTLALAAAVNLGAGLDQVANTAGTGTKPLEETVGKLINVFMSILGIIAVVIVLIGGFTWMTAQGSDKKIQEAKDMLKGGVIGLLVIMAAMAITRFIISKLTEATT